MTFKTLDDLDFNGKRSLVRVDLNLPMSDGKVTDATRLERITPTIKELVEKKAKVILLAHFGRPKGNRIPEMSLEQVVQEASFHFGAPVAFASDCIGAPAKIAIDAMSGGDILILENTRYHSGEEKNDPAFVKELAENGDESAFQIRVVDLEDATAEEDLIEDSVSVFIMATCVLPKLSGFTVVCVCVCFCFCGGAVVAGWVMVAL